MKVQSYVHLNNILGDNDYTKYQYVAFIDIMGIISTFERSRDTAMIFILRFHSVISQLIARDNIDEKITYSPFNDGCFLTADESKVLLDLIRNVFVQISKIFINEKTHKNKFIIRGGFTRGNILHGKDIPGNIKNFQMYDNYKQRFLLGQPIAQAVQLEQTGGYFCINLSPAIASEVKSVNNWFNWIEESDIDITQFKNCVGEYNTNSNHPNNKIHMQHFNEMISP
ncbi:hypothetical protein [Legionella micdadei]|uniref:hypothetical protein n=1 Tax=Legionella micdadei TaxID=451 RepID=UPI0009EF7525|nr:hypothetical protein [Legionella micdadei]ARH00481.1 hypothetical protein B6V88_08605 [Legionella micdadei]